MPMELQILLGGLAVFFALPQLAPSPRALGWIGAALALALVGLTAWLFEGGVNEFSALFALVWLAPFAWALVVSRVARAAALRRRALGRRRSWGRLALAVVLTLLPLPILGV